MGAGIGDQHWDRMSFFPTIWDVLHDGFIVGASCEAPGTVRLDISIEYLRERFADPGELIQITLIGCTRFAYRGYDDPEFITDLSAIAQLGPDFMSAELLDGLCRVHCLNGELEIAATGGSLNLDSGRGLD